MLLRLNESKNNKLCADACCSKSPTLLMCAKCTVYRQESEFIVYHFTSLFVNKHMTVK